MKFSTTIPDYAMSEDAFKSQPDAGTHSRGKSNAADSALRTGQQPKATNAVPDAQCVAGAARNSIDEQTVYIGKNVIINLALDQMVFVGTNASFAGKLK